MIVPWNYQCQSASLTFRTHKNHTRSRYTKPVPFLHNRLMNKAKSDFHSNMISNNSDNPHQLWNNITRTFYRKASVSLPAHDSTNYFSKHFKDTITQIYASFPVFASSCNIDFPVVHHPCTVFKPAWLNDVSILILSSPNKSCELDPNPTFLIQSCLHTLNVPITTVINWTLSSGVFPSHFKHGNVIPLLKKSSLPVNDYNSYRTMSNLSFISKVLEKVVSCRLNVQLNYNHLSNILSVSLQTISLYRNIFY